MSGQGKHCITFEVEASGLLVNIDASGSTGLTSAPIPSMSSPVPQNDDNTATINADIDDGSEIRIRYPLFRVIIGEDSYAGGGETLGAKVWPSAPAMVALLANNPALVKCRNVLEIGCGPGLPGLAPSRRICLFTLTISCSLSSLLSPKFSSLDVFAYVT